MPTSTARTFLAMLALVAASTAACTNDDDTAPTSASMPTSPTSMPSRPTSGPPASPATASTTTPATVPATTSPPPPVAVRLVVGPATDDDESASAGAVLAPANDRGWLLVGTRQSRPGAPHSPALWESADAVAWSDATGPAATNGVSATSGSGVWHGAELVIGGEVIDDAGVRHPAIWTAPDGRTFGEPVDPFGSPGSVHAVTSTPGGPIAAGDIRSAAGSIVPVVALRVGATWTAVTLPTGEAIEASAWAIAASGSSVVVTGWVDAGDVIQAASWVSVDGGATFAIGDASSVHSGLGSFLGAVVVSPHGYVAQACTANGPTSATALAVSPDGTSWRRVDITATSPDGERYPNVTGTCSSLVAAGDRLIVGGIDIGRGYALDVGIDGVGTAWMAPRGRRRSAESSPLVIPLPDGLAAVSRETRGLSSGRVQADTDLPTGRGLPPGQAATTSLVLMPVGGELVARAVRHPIVGEQSTGGYSQRSEEVWARSVDGSSWTRADDALPDGASFVRRGEGPIEIALGAGDDPADHQLDGAFDGAVAWARSPGQPWTEVGLVVSGPGGDSIAAAVAVGAGYVAVGSSSVRDEHGVSTYTPVVRAAADGLDWRAETPPAPSDRAWLDQACPLPGGGVLAIGGAIVDGVFDLYAVRRDGAGTWSPVDLSALPTNVDSFADCALVGSTTALVTTTDDGQSIAVLTPDGMTFEVLPVTVPGAVRASINALVPLDGRLVGAGGVVDTLDRVDVALWTSPDGRSWTRVDVDGFADPSDQTAHDVAVTPDGRLAVAGFDRGAPVVWTLPPP